jgi:hypothetical protein
VSEAADFIDAALQYDVSPYVHPIEEPDGLTRYCTRGDRRFECGTNR